MKKYFYLMSLMLGLMVGSFGLVACGDDDDKGGLMTHPRLRLIPTK